MTGVLRGNLDIESHRHEWSAMWKRGRRQSSAAARQETAKTPTSRQKQGETHEQAPTLLRGAHSHHRLDLGLLASRTVKTKTLCCLSHPAHSTYLRQAQHTNKPPPHVL